MGTKKSKVVAKAAKKIIQAEVEKQKMMPDRQHLTYVANMDNIIFEATFKENSQFDENNKYVPAHLREITSHVIVSVGPLVNNSAMKKGAKIIPIGPGKVNVLEVDEYSLVGSIKPHDIIAIVK